METFQWSPLFETGLADVDAQHQRLVNLVNQLSQNADCATPEHIDQALNELAQYTVYHFQCEEAVMASSQVLALHADRHKETHRRFVAQVVDWLERRKSGEPIDLRQLLDFLANWLIFHILGDDQSLGRQVLAIRAGSAAQTAYERDRTSDDPRMDILLSALQRLYSDLVARNDELLTAQRSLTEINTSLEQRVVARTAELSAANQRLKEGQEKLLEAEKMASLGRMVAGFAHEVNTPVGIAVGAASQVQALSVELDRLLDQEEVTEEDLRSRTGMIGEASTLALNNLRRAAEMVQSFKRTAVDQASDAVRDYDLAELIEDAQKSMLGAFKKTAIMIDITCPEHINLHGPAGVVVQLLTNLLQNSRMHAYADGQQSGCIRIDAGWTGTHVSITYADDGVGMAPEVLQRAFEPFYTTRRGTGGSGLGLYIVFNLVTQALHGTISCDSSPGRGTRFYIEYPARLVGARGAAQ